MSRVQGNVTASTGPTETAGEPYFFATSMPSRNERNSIIFAGTMGLIRRSALERLRGWDEARRLSRV